MRDALARNLGPTLRLTLLTLVLTGLGYPLLVTGLAQGLFPWRASGSLVHRDLTVVGSDLLAQRFAAAGYLQPRPSAAGKGYDALASGGSNLGPTSGALRERVAAEVARLRAGNPGAAGGIPAELVTASGSGLDPHLSPEGALWQAPRIARARGLDLARVEAVIREQEEGRTLGFLGEPRVNVLSVNLALDRRFGAPPQAGHAAAPGAR
jgi:K+-transporting ATPase ATPase C chain